MTATHPTQEDDVKAIRDALAAVPKDWRNLNSARTHPEDDDLAEVGGIDGDGRFSEVFTVDCGNYFAPEASLPLAQFYAAANPERIARLLARLEQAERDAARWRMLPAFIEDHQIDYMRLLRDIDAAIASEAGK